VSITKKQHLNSHVGAPAARFATASMPRRLGAMGYDALVLLAIWFLATALALPLNGGKAIPPGNPWFSAYLAGWAVLYFCGSWLIGGQTIGMRAWRLRLMADRGGLPRIAQILVRFAVSLVSWLPLGLGYWWALGRGDRLCWHDLASGTRPVRLS